MIGRTTQVNSILSNRITSLPPPPFLPTPSLFNSTGTQVSSLSLAPLPFFNPQTLPLLGANQPSPTLNPLQAVNVLFPSFQNQLSKLAKYPI